MDPVVKKLGKRVAALRQQRSMTQDELAESAGLTTEAISRIERGTRAARLGTLARLGDGLGVTLAELFDFAEATPLKQPAYRPEVLQLADLLKGQPRAKLRLVRRIAEVIVGEP